MFHGTDDIDFDLDATNPSSGGFDICTTDDEEIAEMYATRWCSPDAIILELDVKRGAKVADEETAKEMLGLDAWATPGEVFHAVDQSLDLFREAGYDAVRYTDQLPGDGRTFKTTRWINREAVIEVCDRWDV